MPKSQDKLVSIDAPVLCGVMSAGAEALLFLARAALAEGHTAAAGVYAGRVLPMPLAHEVEAVAAAVMAPVPGPVVVPQDEGALFASLGL